MAGQVLLSAILLMVLKESKSVKTPSSCSIPPVKEGEMAVVTCNFSSNINETQDGFQVDKYSTMNNKQETLIACQWIRKKLECLLRNRVIFDEHVTNIFQIQILSVTRDDVGKYVCYVLPDPNGISKNCYLDIYDASTTSNFISSSGDPTKSLTSTPRQEANEDVGMYHTSIILTSISITVLMLQVAIFIAGFYIMKRFARRSQLHSRKVSESTLLPNFLEENECYINPKTVNKKKT